MCVVRAAVLGVSRGGGGVTHARAILRSFSMVRSRSEYSADLRNLGSRQVSMNVYTCSHTTPHGPQEGQYHIWVLWGAEAADVPRSQPPGSRAGPGPPCAPWPAAAPRA